MIKIKGLRWYIAGLLCLASALNYLDRQTLSVLIGTIKTELSLSNASYGDINAWFLASYGIMYAVSGRVIDWIGTRRGFVVFVSGWSLANMLHIFASTVGHFSVFRCLLGVFEPGSFTGGVKAVGEWFPMRDRALAIGIFNAGTAVGSVAAAPVVSVIALQWGWKAAFFITGALGFAWLVPWLLFFRQPKDHPFLHETERQLILEGQREGAAKPRAARLASLLKMRETWGCVLVRALTDPISYFLLFWIPLYFQKQYGFDLKQIGLFIWVPYAAAALGNLSGGIIPRTLIGWGWTLDRARKTTMIFMTGTLLVCLIAVTQIANPLVALLLVAGMTFCHGGWSNITLPAEVFPKNAIATVTGLGGALGSWMGALAMLTTGRVVDDWGFTPVFIACAVLYPLALLLVYVLIGKLGVERTVPD
ncbi:MAG TPA: MFS transporter [Verrucomicrobiota bacterium]|nr:MFS transporter [Verrucomicrobiota bacterium]OQB90929.1 MAG: Hexuronate transporter [Verrucomicrobia bacterium ADurb.Bin118]HPY31789.1 MFS transporter [Verrucomicrobiota bacterium]HQB16886.1 MFS transporter [Verrucomicrobiota bacterium]